MTDRRFKCFNQSLDVSSSVCLSVCLFVCLVVCLFFFLSLFVCLSVCCSLTPSHANEAMEFRPEENVDAHSCTCIVETFDKLLYFRVSLQD